MTTFNEVPNELKMKRISQKMKSKEDKGSGYHQIVKRANWSLGWREENASNWYEEKEDDEKRYAERPTQRPKEEEQAKTKVMKQNSYEKGKVF